MIGYYSLWGASTALFSLIFSIVAMYKESWFRVAFISVEISYAVNFTIMWIFWLILWPGLIKSGSNAVANAKTAEEKKAIEDYMHYIKVYYTIIHFVPFITTVINLAITDMALNKRHWWIAVITLFPFYMLCNLWASMTIGSADG
jgi:hypothetical protein